MTTSKSPTPPPLADDLPPEALAVLAQARRRDTEHAGRRMVWHVWGIGEPLVLLHGGSGSWTHWLRNIEALVQSGRAVHAPDLPGFGDSDLPPQGHDADAMVEPLAAALGQLFGAEPVDLVGFSFGGLASGLLLAQYPRLARRLVLVGAPVLGLGLDLGGRPVRLFEWRHLSTRDERLAVHRTNLAAMMLHRPECITPLAIALQSANLDRDRLRKRRLAQTDALHQALSRMQVPLAAIYGREDALYTTRQEQLDATLRSLPALDFLSYIPDAGHWVQFEQPRAFERELLRALQVAARPPG